MALGNNDFDKPPSSYRVATRINRSKNKGPVMLVLATRDIRFSFDCKAMSIGESSGAMIGMKYFGKTIGNTHATTVKREIIVNVWHLLFNLQCLQK